MNRPNASASVFRVLFILCVQLELSPEIARGAGPNVVVFLADDLGWGDLGCYGHPFIETPNLDRFAAEGLRFTQCYSGGSICSPSRAALLTGRVPFRSGIYHLAGGAQFLRAEEVTVAELLRDGGYQTFFAGKWHLSDLRTQPTPGEQGFDHWLATRGNAGSSTKDCSGFLRNGEPVPQLEGFYCDAIVDEAITWLRGRDPGRPFFVELCPSEPHTPVTPPESFAAMYDNPRIEALAKKVRYGGVDRPTRGHDISANKRLYYGIVTQLDQAFGRLLTALDAMGLSSDTMVLFTSDNGPEHPGGESAHDRNRDRCFGTPGALRGMKRYLFQGGIRVPGIVRWPGHAPAGHVSDEPISGVDILPTLCDLASISPPQDRALDGVSILPTFRGARLKRPVPLTWNIDYRHIPQMALREGEHHLLGYFRPVRPGESSMHWIKNTNVVRFELYNVLRDPEETHNLADLKPELLSRLSVKMKEQWRAIQAEGPTWDKWTSPPKPPLPLWWKASAATK
jgi:arylsulfatase A